MLYVVESVQLDLTSSDSEITLMPGTYCSQSTEVWREEKGGYLLIC